MYKTTSVAKQRKAKHEKNVLPVVEFVELNRLLDVVAFPVEDFLLLFRLKGGSRKLSLSYPRGVRVW